jgi:hypothetical protein
MASQSPNEGVLGDGRDAVDGAVWEAEAVAQDGEPRRRRVRLASPGGTPRAADGAEAGAVCEGRQPSKHVAEHVLGEFGPRVAPPSPVARFSTDMTRAVMDRSALITKLGLDVKETRICVRATFQRLDLYKHEKRSPTYALVLNKN